MRNAVLIVAGAALLAAPAASQVRPEDCRPVFPLVDKVAEVLPQDVVADPAVPAATSRRGFIGLPLLLPALALGGGLIALTDDDDDGGSTIVSPA